MRGVVKPEWSGPEKVYRDWRMKLGVGGVTDVDQIEWDNEGNPLHVIEMTLREDIGRPPPPSFFRAIINRYAGIGKDKDGNDNTGYQGRKVRYVAQALGGVPVYILVYEENLSAVWMYDWTDGAVDGEWVYRSLAAYERWVRAKHGETAEEGDSAAA